jgi:hypothetical protein
MPRAASAIQSEITTLEAYLTSADSIVAAAGSNGTSLSRESRANLERCLSLLYQQLDRANGNAPMLVRGRVKGL